MHPGIAHARTPELAPDRPRQPRCDRQARHGQQLGGVDVKAERPQQAAQQPGRQGGVLVVAPLQAVRPVVLLEVVAELGVVEADGPRDWTA